MFDAIALNPLGNRTVHYRPLVFGGIIKKTEIKYMAATMTLMGGIEHSWLRFHPSSDANCRDLLNPLGRPDGSEAESKHAKPKCAENN